MIFNILRHLDQLNTDDGRRGKDEGSYYCPVCDAPNFKVNLRSGKYNGFSCNCTSKEIRDVLSPLTWEKPPRQQQNRTWTYQDVMGTSLINVRRTDDGQGQRRIWQESLNGKSPAQLKAMVVPYRYQNCLQALHEGAKQVFLVEGEPTVDALWSIKLPAMTLLGGSNGYNSRYRDLLKELPIVLCPDRDQAGIKLMEAIAEEIPNCKWLYAFPDSPLWQRLPAHHGADLADWISEGATQRDILAALETTPRALNGKSSSRLDSSPNSSLRKLRKDQLCPFLEQILGSVRYNLLTAEIEINQKPIRGVFLETLYLSLAETHQIDANKERVRDAVTLIAERNAYNPVEDYLTHVESTVDPLPPTDWQTIAHCYLKTKDPIYDAYLRRTLIAAVARTFQPGCKVDQTTILSGNQGINKSQFWAALGGEWFSDSLGDLRDLKDDTLKLHSAWLHEWGEIDRITSKREAESLKHFISSQIDYCRKPYARGVERLPRRCVLVGTTNRRDFLKDATGNRRYCVIPVKQQIDIARVQEERDRIWTTAIAAYRRGERWWFDYTEELEITRRATDFMIEHPWLDYIQEFLFKGQYIRIDTRSILEGCLDIPAAKQTQADRAKVADCLKGLGWERSEKKVKFNGRSTFIYEKSVDL